MFMHMERFGSCLLILFNGSLVAVRKTADEE